MVPSDCSDGRVRNMCWRCAMLGRPHGRVVVAPLAAGWERRLEAALGLDGPVS